MPPTPLRTYLRPGKVVAALLAVICAVAGIVATEATPASATAPHSLLPTTPAIEECGARRPSDVEFDSTASALPKSPVDSNDVPLGTFNVDTTAYVLHRGSPDEWYVKNGSNFWIYSAALDHSSIATFNLPISLTDVRQRFAVDPAGNVYVLVGGNDLDKFDTSGALIWTRHFTNYADRLVFGYGTNSANFRVAVATRNGTVAWDTAGNPQSTIQVANDASDVSYDQDTNRIDVADGQHVAVYDATTLQRVFYMDAGASGTVGWGITQGDDGTYLVDNGSLKAYSAQGILLGTITADPGAHATGDVDFRGWYNHFGLVHYNGRFYDSFIANNNFSALYLGSVPDSLVSTVTSKPAGAPFGLGAGASVTTNAAANYFPYGSTPKVSINFGSWWAAVSRDFTGLYTVRSMQQILANDPGAPVSFSVPSSIADGSTGTVNVAVPSTRPGYYEVDVRLLQNGTSVSADCLRYSIGAQGQVTDFASMPAGGDARGVSVAAAFGQKIFRSQYNLAPYLPGSDPNGTTPMNLSSLDADVKAAAAEAAADGVVYEMQLATGSSQDKNLLTSGAWQARVQEWVAHFSALGVHAYEAWNEPNNTYNSNGAIFTTNVLKPFYAGVKAADPSATVIGGGILGDSYSYFSSMVTAGALNYMDAAGVHPYTGHNRSFEEQGILPNLQKIQGLFAANGKPNLPVYATESGFWNNGLNQYYDQGDKLIRKAILMQSIGMDWNANFYNFGDYLVDGNSWSLLGSRGLTAAGLASLTYVQYTAGRPFLRMLTTAAPHTYAAEYGASSTDSGHVVAVWSDDYTVSMVPALSSGGAISTADEWGGTGTYTGGSLTLTGSVTYLQVPAGQTLTIQPAESYDANLALASNGAMATASSHAQNGTKNYGAATLANDGITDTHDLGNNFDGISAWVQLYTDQDPWLQITLAAPQTIDRIYVSSQGLGSVQTGLRSYDIQVDPGNGTWTTVASVQGQYFARDNLITIPAQTVSKLRLVNMTVNYSGYGDGLPPTFWPANFLSAGDVWSGQATVYEVEAYAPGTVTKSTGDGSSEATAPPSTAAPTPTTSSAPAPTPTTSSAPAPAPTTSSAPAPTPTPTSSKAPAPAPTPTTSSAPAPTVLQLANPGSVSVAQRSGVSWDVRTSTAGATYRLASGSLPRGVALTSAGIISGTPTATGRGTVTIRATAPSGTGTTTFSWTVVAPKVTVTKIAPKTTLVGNQVKVTGTARDTYRTNFSWAGSGLPGGVAVNASSGVISGKPSRAGTYRVVLTATDTARAKASTVFTWKVKPHNLVRTGAAGITQARGSRTPVAAAATALVQRSVRAKHAATAVLGTLHEDSARGRVLAAKVSYRWYLDGHRVRPKAGRSIAIPASWVGHKLRFVAVVRATVQHRAYTYTSKRVRVAR